MLLLNQDTHGDKAVSGQGDINKEKQSTLLSWYNTVKDTIGTTESKQITKDQEKVP